MCGYELHTFSCTVTGTQLIWGINTSSPLRIEFLSRSHDVGKSIPRLPNAVGILLHNADSQLKSAIFVNYSQLDQSANYNITCSSDTGSASLQTSFSGEL